MRKNMLWCAVASVVVLASFTGAIAMDNWMGIWKLDPGASKFSPGPAPKEQVLKFSSSDEGTLVRSEAIGADGKAVAMSYISKYDGSEVPWKGNPNADSTSVKRIDANTYESAWKKGGKPTMRSRVVVSADGKTLTITQSGTDAQGKAVSNTAVYHRP